MLSPTHAMACSRHHNHSRSDSHSRAYVIVHVSGIEVGGGGLLQVDTFTARRYCLHWINWVSKRRTPETRKLAKDTANKTNPPEKHTDMATATHRV